MKLTPWPHLCHRSIVSNTVIIVMLISIQAKFIKSFFILSSKVYTHSGAPHLPRTWSLTTAIVLLFPDMGTPNTHRGINITLAFCAWLISLSTSASKFNDAIHVTVRHSFTGWWMCHCVYLLPHWWAFVLLSRPGEQCHREQDMEVPLTDLALLLSDVYL